MFLLASHLLFPAASGGGGGPPPTTLVSITNQNVEYAFEGLGNRVAGYRLNTAGNAQGRENTNYYTLENWLVSGASSDYVAYVTATGDTVTGTLNAEVALSSSPEWYVTTAGYGSVTATLTVQIRKASDHSVLDTATITLYAERNPIEE
jgi:hypothetical protein